MNILFATSEIAPWVKTGAWATWPPPSRRPSGRPARTCGCSCRATRPSPPPFPRPGRPPPCLPGPAAPRPAACWRRGRRPAAVSCRLPRTVRPPGNPYLDSHGHDWGDNDRRFGLLSRLAALLGQARSPLDWRPDVVHVNDWQTALAPAYLHYEGGAASVVTVHNIAFQGCFPAGLRAGLGLPEAAWRFDGVEYHGQLSFLKAGLQLADQLSTVSPLRPGNPGRSLRLRSGAASAPSGRRLRGILNGIDTAIWNPARDAASIILRAARLAAKRGNRRALQEEMGLEVRDDRPIFGVVSRLTQQKGLDLLLTVGHGLPHLPAQLVVLGSGDKAFGRVHSPRRRPPRQVAVTLGFSERLAHRIKPAPTFFLMPSRFEPCGLNQMYSLAYGTPPLVRATGSLADTVVDLGEASLAEGSANGFVFADANPHAFWLALERAARTWHDRRTWRRLQQNGMRRDWSWKPAAQAYLQLYRDALAAKR